MVGAAVGDPRASATHRTGQTDSAHGRPGVGGPGHTGAGVKLTPVPPASGVYLLRVDPVDLETGGATFTVSPA